MLINVELYMEHETKEAIRNERPVFPTECYNGSWNTLRARILQPWSPHEIQSGLV